MIREDWKKEFPKESKRASLPREYLEKGYFDEKGNLREELILTWAEEIARNLEKTKKHQIRRFYNHVKALQRKSDLLNNFDCINADLKKLIPFAVQAIHRESQRASPILEEFLKKNLEKVKDLKTFNAFVNHFEAIVCYCEKYLK